jgi:hypothetical protein
VLAKNGDALRKAIKKLLKNPLIRRMQSLIFSAIVSIGLIGFYKDNFDYGPLLQEQKLCRGV